MSEAADGYRSACNLLEYTRVVREGLAIETAHDRLFRAELEAWSERAIACAPKAAVDSLEQLLFPAYEMRPSAWVPVPPRGDGHVLAWSALGIALTVVVGAVANRAGVSFTFARPEGAIAEWGRERTAVAAIHLPVESDDAAVCIAARDHRCVRALLSTKLDALSPARRKALRNACAALADYGCVLRVDAAR